MMRLSCLTLSYQNQFRAGKMDIFSFLTTCRSLALDGADIHMRGLMNTGRPHLKEVRRRALDMGLSISCLAVTTEFGRSAEAVPKEIEKAREAMDVGMFLGAPILRVFVGSAPSEDKRKEAFDRSVEALRKCAEFGAEAGMPVALQNHSGLTSTGDDMLAFYKAVNHPNFTLLMDTGHLAGRDVRTGRRLRDHLRQLLPVARRLRRLRSLCG